MDGKITKGPLTYKQWKTFLKELFDVIESETPDVEDFIALNCEAVTSKDLEESFDSPEFYDLATLPNVSVWPMRSPVELLELDKFKEVPLGMVNVDYDNNKDNLMAIEAGSTIDPITPEELYIKIYNVAKEDPTCLYYFSPYMWTYDGKMRYSLICSMDGKKINIPFRLNNIDR